MDSHNIELDEFDSDSPLSSLRASPVPFSTGKDDGTQDRTNFSAETYPFSKVIIDPSCVVGVAPSWDKAKRKIEELEREFPDDLPYIITYEKKCLEMMCQECNRNLQLEGANIGNIRRHANSVCHGIRVKRRLDSKGLKEVLTSEVEARNLIIINSTESIPRLEARHQRILLSQQQKEFSQQNPSKDGELRSSKRRRLSRAPPMDNHDLQSKNAQTAVCVPQASKQSKVSPVVSERSTPVSESIAIEIFQRLTDIEHQHERDMVKQRDRVHRIGSALIGLEKLSGERLASLERNAKEQRNETKNLMAVFDSFTKLYNDKDRDLARAVTQHSRLIEDSKIRDDTSPLETKVSLANVEGTLEEQKNITDNLANLLSDVEGKLEGQKNITDNLANLLSGVGVKLEGQKNITNNLANLLSGVGAKLEGQKEVAENLAHVFTSIENELKGVKKETENLTARFENWDDSRKSGGLLESDGATGLLHHEKQIETLEQTISTYRYDVIEENRQFMEKQGDRIQAAMDRIVTSEALTHELKRTLEDLAHITASKADIDRMTGFENDAAGLHKKLEELTSQIDKRHLSQHKLLIEAVERKMCSIELIIKRVENLEKYLEESRTFKEQFVNLEVFTKGLDQKLVDSDSRQSSLHQQLQENLERRMTVSTSLQDRVVTLENQITKHPKRLGPITDLAPWRDGGLEEPVSGNMSKSLSNSENIFSINNQVTELGREVGGLRHKLEVMANSTTMRQLGENKVPAEITEENTANFRSTFDQVTPLQKEVQEFGNKPGDVATAAKNRQIQQGKDHTELIQEKMSIAQTEFDKMVTELKTQLSNMTSQAAMFESSGEQNGSRDYQIDDLVQSSRLMMMRVAALEKNEKHSDGIMMMRLAALEEKNEKQVFKVVELERANEKLQREVNSLRQPVV